MMGPPTGTQVYPADYESAPETGPVSTIMNRQEERPPQKRSKAWIWIGSIFVLLALAALALWVYEINKPPEIVQVQVADVAGLDADAAEAQLRNQGFQVTPEEQYSTEVDEGKAISTDPAAGQSIPENSQVKLLVSLGPESVSIPEVAGKTEEEARQILKDAKLQAGTHITQNSPDVKKGVVIETKPGEGEKVDVDSNVDLVVSSGMVKVPDVTGQTADEACNTLKGDDYKLGCKVEEVETADQEEGKVYEQSTPGGTDVAQGSEITVTVAKKPPEPTPTIPSVPGGIPTSPSDDAGGDGNDNGSGGTETDGAVGGGESWFDGWSDGRRGNNGNGNGRD